MRPEELVRRRVDIIHAGDSRALGEVLAPNVITHYGSGEPVHGLEALALLLAGFEEPRGSIQRPAPGSRVEPRAAAGARPGGSGARARSPELTRPPASEATQRKSRPRR
jgi:hypothetical protein